MESNAVSGWFWQIGDWRAWVHTIYAGAVGAIGSAVLLWFAVAAGFGGVGVAIGLGIAALLIFGLLFAVGALFHPRGSRMPSAIWLGVSVILWAACLAGTLVVASQASINAQQPSEWIAPAIGGITAAAAALVTWPGPGRIVAVAGVIAALAFIEPWPVPPKSPVQVQQQQIGTVVPYMAQLEQYPYYGDPEPLPTNDGMLWRFRAVDAPADDPDVISFAVITENGAPEACGPQLWVFVPGLATDAEHSCEATSIDGLSDSFLRISGSGHELSAVIDGTRVRVSAPTSTPESVLEEALRSAAPMPQQMYEAWIVTRE